MILPQKVLAGQTCTQCLNYLSIGPVMVKGGKIMCGRCTTQKTKELSQSLYNKIAEQCVFKCINHYAGCEELLAFNEATEHEKTCKKENFWCPFCVYKGNGCQLVAHFNKVHSKYIVEENTFKVDLESSVKKLILVENDSIFCLTLSIINNVLETSNLLITSRNSSMKHFKIRLPNLPYNLEYVTPATDYNTDRQLFGRTYDHFSLPPSFVAYCPGGTCLGRIELVVDKIIDTEEKILELTYLKKVHQGLTESKKSAPIHRKEPVGEYLEITDIFDGLLEMQTPELKKFVCSKLNKIQVCSGCSKYLNKRHNLYFCPKNHMVCSACTNKKCPKCNALCVWDQRYKDLVLRCEWTNCTENINIFEYLVHKQRCACRLYKCPGSTCGLLYKLDDLMTHWHLTPYRSGIAVEFVRNEAYYWLLPRVNEFVYVTVEQYSSWLQSYIIVKINDTNSVLQQAYDFNMCAKNNQDIYEYNAKWEYLSSETGRCTTIPENHNIYELRVTLKF